MFSMRLPLQVGLPQRFSGIAECVSSSWKIEFILKSDWLYFELILNIVFENCALQSSGILGF